MRKEIVGNDKVFIGRLGDDDVREFAFDLSEYTSCMDGTFSVSCLFVLPSKSDSEAYAIAIDHYRLEGNQLIWIPTNAECSETGWGKFEAILYNDGQQVASLIWRVQVGKSLVGDEEPPEGWENYILAVERLVDRIEDMTATASVDNTTGTPSVTVTKTENPLNLDFAFHNIKGAKGDKGDTGSKGETGNGIVSIVKTGTSGLVDTYTITYDNGDTDTFTVTNGEKGDKGDKGNTGATPDIYTTAVTLAEGSSAYAHVSGTIEQPLITFGIPKGDTGAQPPLSDDLPLMDGTASAGTDTEASRSDHVHPHDTTLLPSDTVSGNPLAISDGYPLNAKGLSVALEPIQDLHGYDNPWPSGGGKNKLPPVTDDTYTYNGVTITSKNGVFTIKGTASAGFNSKTFALSESVDMSPSINKIAFLNNFTNGSFTVDFMRDTTRIHFWGMSENNRVASGWTDTGNEVVNGIAFYVPLGWSGDVTISPMFVLLADSNPTIFAPYSNICPITGRDEVSVERTGKNLLDITEATEVYKGNSQYFTLSYVDNGVTMTPTVAGSLYVIWSRGMRITADMVGQKLILSNALDNGAVRIALSPSADTVDWSSNTTVVSPYTITSSNVGKYVGIRLINTTGNVAHLTNVQLELGSTATEYEPYASASVTVSLGQTVYGGTVDVTNGVLTVDKVKYVFEGDKTYTFSSTFFYTYLTTGMAKSGYYLTENGVDINYNPTNGQVRIYLSRNSFLTSESDMDDYLYSGIGFVYDLPTPITITLTPQDLALLQGDNVITSDGTITLTYKCEIQKYIQKLIASLV